VTFAHPLLLLTLLAVPAAVGLYLLAERRRMRYAIRFTNVDVLADVLKGRVWRQYIPPTLFLFAVAALCVGVARPQRTTLVPKDRATVILVVDVSRSMEAKDVKPSRIGAAAAAVRLFLDKVPDRLQIGLIAFAGDPAVAAPPTTDHRLVREALDTLQWYPSFGGTAIGDALAEAVRLGQEAVGGGNGNLASVRTAAPDQTKGLVSILFLSDGAQTRGELLPLDGADRARAAGIPVYTVALGTPHGTLRFGFSQPPQGFPGGFGQGRVVPVPPDPDTLRAIASRTGGQFFAARDAKSLRSAYSKLGSRLGRKPGESEITYGFLAGAAGLLVAAGLLSALWSPRLP
jgi:Ca-activated chloride channel family protein